MPAYSLAAGGLIASCFARKSTGTDAAVRLAMAAVTLADLGPTASKQLVGAAAARRKSNRAYAEKAAVSPTLTVEEAERMQRTGDAGRRWQRLVRAKVVLDLASLSLMVAGRTAARGAALLLVGHVAWWLLGAADLAHGADGSPAPLPPGLGKIVLTADSVVAALALLGAFCPGERARSYAAAALSLALGSVAVGKLKPRAAPGEAPPPPPPTTTRRTTPPPTMAMASGQVAEEASGHVAASGLAAEERAAVGGSDASRLWSDVWWPLAFEQYTSKTAPVPIELLGAKLVLWWDEPSSAWRVTSDACPHRLAPLSEGRIADSGEIECPYHGWRFGGGDGACTCIPTLKEGGQIDSARARVLPLATMVEQGIIWAWGGALSAGGSSTPPPTARPHTVEAVDMPGVSVMDYSRDLHMEATTLCENVMDPAHLPFTHHGTISKRSAAQVIPFHLRKPLISANGFVADRPTEGWPGLVTYTAPDLVLAETHRGAGGFSDWNVVYAIPTKPGHCRLLVRVVFETSAMKPPLKWVIGFAFNAQPRWLTHLSNHVILEDDNVFLHTQGHSYRDAPSADGDAPEGGTCPAWRRRLHMPTSADSVVRTYHKWLDEYTGGRGVAWSDRTPALSRDGARLVKPRSLLLERHNAHVVHCTACAGALANARRLRVAADAAVALALLGGAALRRSALGLAVAAIAFGGGRACAEVERRLCEGKVTPPRNAL